MLRKEIIEKTLEIEEKINVCKIFASGLEIIKATFDRCEGIASSVEKDTFANITYIDIRFKIGNAVCFEFTVEDEKVFNYYAAYLDEKIWSDLEVCGYAYHDTLNEINSKILCCYYLNRKGLDWLGKQLNITIYDN